MNIRKAVVATLAVALLGAGCGPKGTQDAQQDGQKKTEDAYSQLSKAVPYVIPRNSLERRNLAERLKRTDDPTHIGYVYLLNFGKLMGYYVVKGKVSNPDSQLTTDQLIVDKGSNVGVTTVDAPGDDGSYGPNERGIFFFTVEGVMVTTSLDYIWSDQLLPVNVPKLNSGKQ